MDEPSDGSVAVPWPSGQSSEWQDVASRLATGCCICNHLPVAPECSMGQQRADQLAAGGKDEQGGALSR